MSGRDISYTIEPSRNKWEEDKVEVIEHGVYPEHSVLAGQARRAYRGTFDTVKDALSEFPDAEVLEHNTLATASVPQVAPDWFDPADAGERWEEEC